MIISVKCQLGRIFNDLRIVLIVHLRENLSSVPACLWGIILSPACVWGIMLITLTEVDRPSLNSTAPFPLLVFWTVWKGETSEVDSSLCFLFVSVPFSQALAAWISLTFWPWTVNSKKPFLFPFFSWDILLQRLEKDLRCFSITLLVSKTSKSRVLSRQKRGKLPVTLEMTCHTEKINVHLYQAINGK